jgi:hypothetical protein
MGRMGVVRSKAGRQSDTPLPFLNTSDKILTRAQREFAVFSVTLAFGQIRAIRTA